MRFATAVVAAVFLHSASSWADSPDIASLVDQLGWGGLTRESAREAERSLEQIGKPALPTLVNTLRARRRQGEWPACIRLIARIDPATALRVLPPFLDDEHVSRDVIEALGTLGRRAAPFAPAIERYLNDPDALTKIFSRMALINLTGEAAPHVDALATIALDPAENDSARFLAAEALWSLGDRVRFVYPGFVRAFKDHNPRVRHLAVKAFNIKGPTSDEIVAGLIDVMEHDPLAHIRDCAAGALATIGPAAKPATAALTRVLDSDPQEGWIYASALISIGGEGVLPPLYRALDSKHKQTRLTTASGLHLFTSSAPEVVRVLRDHANDPSPEVMGAIEQSLEMLTYSAPGP
jgi:HEAT repeat protein